MKTVISIIASIVPSVLFAACALVDPAGNLLVTAPSYAFDGRNLTMGSRQLEGINPGNICLIEFDGSAPVLEEEVTVPQNTLYAGSSNVVADGITNTVDFISTNTVMVDETHHFNIHTSTLPNVRRVNLQLKIQQQQTILRSLLLQYAQFLSVEWTSTLKEYAIIPSNTPPITVQSTSTLEILQQLMALRAVDTQTNKPTYSYFRDEFNAFRTQLESAGYSTADLPALIPATP